MREKLIAFEAFFHAETHSSRSKDCYWRNIWQKNHNSHGCRYRYMHVQYMCRQKDYKITLKTNWRKKKTTANISIFQTIYGGQAKDICSFFFFFFFEWMEHICRHHQYNCTKFLNSHKSSHPVNQNDKSCFNQSVYLFELIKWDVLLGHNYSWSAAMKIEWMKRRKK